MRNNVNLNITAIHYNAKQNSYMYMPKPFLKRKSELF